MRRKIFALTSLVILLVLAGKIPVINASAAGASPNARAALRERGMSYRMGRHQAGRRHRMLIPAFLGSNPSAPAFQKT